MAEQYKDFVNSCWRYEPIDSELYRQLGYAALAMVSESGEAGDAVKKVLRGDDIDSKVILNECGDVLYYMTKLLNLVGYTIDDAIKANIEKLNYRAIHGKEKSS